jgi:uncharacterized protein YbjQ (UPF0145 family)
MNCTSCLTTKATLKCGLCDTEVCKSCAMFVDDDSFSFLKSIPETLQKDAYCHSCYEANVQQELQSYEETMQKARGVFVYNKEQGKETRLMKRSLPQIKIKDCADKEDALLRLAFLAVQANCNAIIDVEVKSEKVREHAYQTLKWHATATPTNVEHNRFNK